MFLFAGAFLSGVCVISLLQPGGFLDPIWQLNPRARVAFGSMGPWAPLLLGPVSLACLLAAVGLWRGRRWGHRLAFGILTVNLFGDIINAVTGIEPRAAVGVPIVVAILWYLCQANVRTYFSREAGA